LFPHETRFDDLAAVDHQFRLLRQSSFVEVVESKRRRSHPPPMVKQAFITVDSVYDLDASTDQPGTPISQK